MPDTATPSVAAPPAATFGAMPAEAHRRVPMGVIGVAVVGVVVVAAMAVAFPLLTFAVSLAAFGMPHVLAELRYVDARFNSRLTVRLRWGLVVVLALIVLGRVGYLAGMVPYRFAVELELLLVIGLAVLVWPILWRAGWFPAIVGAAVLVAVGMGVAWAPVETIVAFAVLHNVTPVGFLAERLRGSARTAAMMACAAVFVGVPLVIASGWPFEWLASAGLVQIEWNILATGELEKYLGTFVPRSLHGEFLALHLFSAAVFLQCMHYAVVIGVLPRLDSDHDWARPWSLVAWPSRRAFAVFLVTTGIFVFAMFALSFDRARSFYGLAAAVHAWVEIPILLLALALPAAARAAAATSAASDPS